MSTGTPLTHPVKPESEFIMKKLLIPLIGSFTLVAALPAVAGPDWYLIEKARKEKQAAAIARHGDAVSTPGAGDTRCPDEPPVLLLDHGPRAQTTPYVNRLREERYEAELKACEGAKK